MSTLAPSASQLFFLLFFKSLPEDMSIDFYRERKRKAGREGTREGEREREREKEREIEREKDWCMRGTWIGCLPYMPGQGIEPSTFWCTGWHSNHLRYSARVTFFFLTNLASSLWVSKTQSVAEWFHLNQSLGISGDIFGCHNLESATGING